MNTPSRSSRLRQPATLLVALLGAVACAPPPPASSPGPAVAAASPAAAPAPVVSPAAPAPPAPPPPPASATDVLSQGRAPFDACYAKARAAHPQLGRTSVEMTFTIDTDGSVRAVDLEYRNRMDDAAKDCMRSAAEALRFPASLRGKETGTIVFTP